MVNDNAIYIAETVIDELGLEGEEAINVLVDAIKEVARKTVEPSRYSNLLEDAGVRLAE
jgi:hypothetical protein